MLKAIGTIIFTVTYIIVWGFLLCIGFWLGRKFTDRLDLGVTRKVADRCAEALGKEFPGKF